MDHFVVYSFVFIYGIAIGSFLNVCIFRIPEGESIVTGRSHCTSCNTRIKWYDLVPIFGYLFLLGRCRSCKTKISIQYPIIEALNGLLYVLVFYLNGWNSYYSILFSCISCLVISALIVLSVIDMRTNIIPFGINIFILVMGLAAVLLKFIWLNQSHTILVEHAIGFVAVSSFLLLIFLASKGRGMGGGDIKLMAAAGLLLGWQLIVLAFFIGCVLAAVIHPIRMKINKISRVLAFGPYLAVGIAVSMLYGEQIIRWYLSTFFI